MSYSFSIEESNGANSDDPVFTAAAGYNTDTWTARIAGLAGRVTDVAGSGNDLSYNAVTVSGSVTPWQGGRFTASYVTGDAIGSLLIGGGDDIVGGQTNGATGYTFEFTQALSDQWSVGIAYGNEDYDATIGTGTAGILSAETVHLTATYSPVKNLSFAAEYIMLERESGSGIVADADRIGASVTFRF